VSEELDRLRKRLRELITEIEGEDCHAIMRFSEKSGLSQNIIRQWLCSTSKSPPKQIYLNYLKEKLRISPDYLLYGIEPKFIEPESDENKNQTISLFQKIIDDKDKEISFLREIIKNLSQTIKVEPDISVENLPNLKLETVEYRHIQNVLETFKGDKTKASAALGISLSSLYRKLSLIEE